MAGPVIVKVDVEVQSVPLLSSPPMPSFPATLGRRGMGLAWLERKLCSPST